MSKDIIIADLKQKILAGELAPGAWLVERDLSALYGLSRTPIREILRELMANGLIEQEPAKGYKVKIVRFEEVVDTYNARQAVEGMAARLACQKADPDFLAAIHDLKKRLEAAPVETDARLGSAIGSRLHEYIIDAAGNPPLSEFYNKLKVLTELTRNICKISVDIELDSKKAHLAIIDAIEQGDPDAAEAAMREHMRVTCNSLVDGYLKSSIGGKGGLPVHA